MIVTSVIYKSTSLIGPDKITIKVEVGAKNVLGHVFQSDGSLYLDATDLVEMYQAMDNTGKHKFLEIFATLLQDWERLHQLEMFDEEEKTTSDQTGGQMGSQGSYDPPRMLLRSGEGHSC